MQTFFIILAPVLVFLSLRELHNASVSALLAEGWMQNPAGVLLSGALYGLIFCAAGRLVFQFLFKRFQQEDKSGPLKIVLLRPGPVWLHIGMGLAAGLFLYGLIGLKEHFFPAGSESGFAANLRLALQKDSFLSVVWFFQTGLIVPIFEEFFYRATFQEYLEKHKFHGFLTVGLPALCFGLSHYYYVAPFIVFVGLVFGTMYRKGGLISGILAHSVYNLLILFQAKFAA